MSKPVQAKVGCLLFIAVYVLLLVPSYYLSRPAAVTEDFTGRNARLFNVAAVASANASGSSAYSSHSLDQLDAGTLDLATLTFLLAESKITIEQGDIHHATVAEDHGSWQLVEFHYSNTHTSTSKPNDSTLSWKAPMWEKERNS